MSKGSPNVIFKNKYCLALNSRDNKNISPIYEKNRLNDIDNMIDYFSDVKKKTIGMFEYYMGHTRKEKYNLILENGSYATKDDIQRLKKEYKKYIEKSNLWKGILSFKKEYLDENIDIKTLEQKIAKEVIPNFLKYCGFKDIKNMSYVFSVHTNRVHQPHIHFAFIEKCPNFKCTDKKIGYRRKGKISLDEQRYLKRLVELTIEREKFYTPLLKKTNEDIDNLKSYFNSKERNFALHNISEIYVEEDILKLGELLNQYRLKNNQVSKKIKYNSIKNDELGKEIKEVTNRIKKYLFNDENSILYNAKEEINKDLIALNQYFDNLDKNNNIKDVDINNSIVSRKEEYIDNYIYNSIVNHSLYKYNYIKMIVKDKKNENYITIDDLIQEIAYLNNKKSNNISDKQRRKLVLENYFKGGNNISKFPNKLKMERALKNINYEMDKASEEFSKLFNYNDRKI